MFYYEGIIVALLCYNVREAASAIALQIMVTYDYGLRDGNICDNGLTNDLYIKTYIFYYDNGLDT